MPLDEFKARMDELVRQVKASRLAEGTPQLRLPGKESHHHKERNLREGLYLPVFIVERLQSFGERVGVPFPAAE